MLKVKKNNNNNKREICYADSDSCSIIKLSNLYMGSFYNFFKRMTTMICVSTFTQQLSFYLSLFITSPTYHVSITPFHPISLSLIKYRILLSTLHFSLAPCSYSQNTPALVN